MSGKNVNSFAYGFVKIDGKFLSNKETEGPKKKNEKHSSGKKN